VWWGSSKRPVTPKAPRHVPHIPELEMEANDAIVVTSGDKDNSGRLQQCSRNLSIRAKENEDSQTAGTATVVSPKKKPRQPP
jgi:hypothetical protein